MYVEIVKNRNSPPAILLRESYREGDKVKKRTLANLSALPMEAIEAIRMTLKGKKLVDPSEAFEVVASLPHGGVAAVKMAMERLEMRKLFPSRSGRERDIVLAMIAQRVLFPASKHESAALFAQSTLAEEFRVTDAEAEDLYSAMDWLVERQSGIESKLAKRHLSEGCQVFYDISSSTYYGNECVLAEFGYNRDGIRGERSIVYGLLTDAVGKPVAIRVYPGSTSDPATVPDRIDDLRQEFEISRFVFVGDRGMLTSAQIDKLRETDGCGWISCLRSSDISKVLEGSDPSEAPLFSREGLAEISHPDYPGERLVVCHNPLLADDRRRTRNTLLDKAEEGLERVAAEVSRRTRKPMDAATIGMKTQRVLSKYKMGKHFELDIVDGSISWSRNPRSIAREEAIDGIYVVRTSETDMPAEEAVRAYKRLANVERAFRTIKGTDLKIRPIYHHLENRVRAHMFICMLAYYVEWHMRQALAPMMFAEEDLEQLRDERDPVKQAAPSQSVKDKRGTKRTADGMEVRSWQGILSTLSTIVRNTCRHGDAITTFTMDTRLSEYQTKIFDLLKQESPVWQWNVASKSAPKTES